MTKPEDKRIGWLAELSVGDDVYIRCGDLLSEAQIKRITPSGLLVVGRQRFRSNGSVSGVRGLHLVKIDESSRQEMLQQRNLLEAKVLIEKLRKIQSHQLTTADTQNLVDHLRQAVALFEKHQKDG